MDSAIKPTLVSGLIVLCFAAFFGYNTIHLQHRQRLQQLHAQLSEEQATQALRVQTAQTLKDIERLRKRLPQEPETEWLVREVGRLAQGAGVQLTSINPQAPKPLQDATQLTVSVQFTAPYHQLGGFLSTIESATSFLRVDSLDILPSHSAATEHAADIRMTISTFSVPSLAGTR